MTEEQFDKLPHYVKDEIWSLQERVRYLETISRPIMANVTNDLVNRKGATISYLPEDHGKIQKFLLSPNAWVTVLFDGSFHIIDIYFDMKKESIIVAGPGDIYSSASTMNVVPLAQDKIEINLHRYK